MKKLLITSNLLFIAIVYFQNCTIPKMLVGAQPGSNKNWHCINYNDSVFSGIPLSVSSALYNKYGTTQYMNITSGNNALVEDSRCVWFSLDIIKKFIYKVEDTLFRKGFNPNTRLGIRFYFATYPDSATMRANPYLDGLPSSYANHHTLFMVPTFDSLTNGTRIHYDFNAFNGLNGNNLPFANKILQQKDVLGFWSNSSASLTVSDDIYMQNHGEVGPPPSPVPGSTF